MQDTFRQFEEQCQIHMDRFFDARRVIRQIAKLAVPCLNIYN